MEANLPVVSSVHRKEPSENDEGPEPEGGSLSNSLEVTSVISNNWKSSQLLGFVKSSDENNVAKTESGTAKAAVEHSDQSYEETSNDDQAANSATNPNPNPNPKEKVEMCLIKAHLKNRTAEPFDFKKIHRGDVIRMNGMCGPLYHHYGLVLSRDQAKGTIAVAEFNIRTDKNIITLIHLAFESILKGKSPLSRLVLVQKSIYKSIDLLSRNAEKVMFCPELQKFVNIDRAVERAENDIKSVSVASYRLRKNNCEHKVYQWLFNCHYSSQADKFFRELGCICLFCLFLFIF